MDRRKSYEYQFLALLAKAMKQQHKSKDQEKDHYNSLRRQNDIVLRSKTAIDSN